MKLKFINKITSAALLLALSVSTTSCVNDLNQSIKDPQTNTTFNQMGTLAKIYGNLILTGIKGPAGDATKGEPDMAQFDEGNSSLYRRIFEANELPSDETVWTWQSDPGISDLTNLNWNSSHGLNNLTYYRLEFNITLCNFFLDNTEGKTDAETLKQRAEVRFLRALHYYYFIDLYGKAPFKEHYNTDIPVEKSRKDVFDYITAELKAISDGSATDQLSEPGTAAYGRADKAAAWMLLARLYLNAGVYTGTPQWQAAKDYSDKVINESGYKLNTQSLNGYTAYEQLFMGDNGENQLARQEIIFPIRCDGKKTQSYSGSEYAIASTRGNGTPACGTTEAWTCNRAREAMVLKFFKQLSDVPLATNESDNGEANVRAIRAAARDDRAMFYGGGEMKDGALKDVRTTETSPITSFTAGLSILKWSNVYATGGRPSDTKFPDTDVPLFRVAEAYLTRAEANYRLGVAPALVLNDINVIRSRANAQPLTQVDDKILCDEWSREFYFEGRRRSDLVRFGFFTSGKYMWDWKGGTYKGNAVNAQYNLFPIPFEEQDHISQNPGY